MRLGFHYHIPAFERDGRIYTSGFLGVFLDSLAHSVDELVCFMHTPLESEMSQMDYCLKNRNIKLVSLGPHTTLPHRLLRSKRLINTISVEVKKVNILLIRSPTPLLPAISKVTGVKKAFMIVGDYQKSSKDLQQPFFRKIAIQLWARLNKWQQSRAIKNALVLVNNGLIYQELQPTVKKLFLVKTTTLQSEDFFYREDTCQSKEVNLLYTGRIDLSKGLMEIIEALSWVRKQGVDALLHIVGWEDKNSNETTDVLKQYANKLLIKEFVFFHGRKQVGAELNNYYRRADIFIIGSKANEGFPRTIWESMANCCPVVASRIGSIPLFLNEGTDAILTVPGSVESISEAVMKLIKCEEQRKLLIKNGYKLAQANTLDKQTSKIITLLNEYSRN